MDYSMGWIDDAKRVLLLQFKDEITWDDFHVVIDEAHGKVGEQQHEVDLILWYRTGRLPQGNPVVQFQSVMKRQPENMGKIVVINPQMNTGIGKYMSVLAKMMSRLAPQMEKVKLVATYEEACKILDLDPSAARD